MLASDQALSLFHQAAPRGSLLACIPPPLRPWCRLYWTHVTSTGRNRTQFIFILPMLFRSSESNNVQPTSLMEISPERVTFVELLGRGAFGNVHKSVMKESPETNTSSKLGDQSLDAHEGKIVATKVLRGEWIQNRAESKLLFRVSLVNTNISLIMIKIF